MSVPRTDVFPTKDSQNCRSLCFPNPGDCPFRICCHSDDSEEFRQGPSTSLSSEWPLPTTLAIPQLGDVCSLCFAFAVLQLQPWTSSIHGKEDHHSVTPSLLLVQPLPQQSLAVCAWPLTGQKKPCVLTHPSNSSSRG